MSDKDEKKGGRIAPGNLDILSIAPDAVQSTDDARRVFGLPVTLASVVNETEERSAMPEGMAAFCAMWRFTVRLVTPRTVRRVSSTCLGLASSVRTDTVLS